MSNSAWVASLGKSDQANWAICRELQLWGSGSNNAGHVQVGDEIFIWRSGSGWFARCIVTSAPVPPTQSHPAPWPDGRTYKWMFGIRVVQELEEPIKPRSGEGGLQEVTGLYNIQLGQFPRLTAAQRLGVSSFYGLTNVAADPVEEIERQAQDDEHERTLRERTDIGPFEVERLVTARTGQGRFRENVLRVESTCRITGLSNSTYLIASHIKPWRNSDDEEKIDGNNGLLLSPHVDKLFDQGWIRFNNDGRFEPSPILDPAVFAAWKIEPSRNPQGFNTRQQEYLEYHRTAVFKLVA